MPTLLSSTSLTCVTAAERVCPTMSRMGQLGGWEASRARMKHWMSVGMAAPPPPWEGFTGMGRGGSWVTTAESACNRGWWWSLPWVLGEGAAEVMAEAEAEDEEEDEEEEDEEEEEGGAVSTPPTPSWRALRKGMAALCCSWNATAGGVPRM